MKQEYGVNCNRSQLRPTKQQAIAFVSPQVPESLAIDLDEYGLTPYRHRTGLIPDSTKPLLIGRYPVAHPSFLCQATMNQIVTDNAKLNY